MNQQYEWKYNHDKTVRYKKSRYGIIVEYKPFENDLRYSMELPKLLK